MAYCEASLRSQNLPQGTDENHENINQDDHPATRKSNWGPSEYEG
jgi:hypothetical protein